MVRPVYRLEHARDFCLPHIEIWCRGETTVPKPYSNGLNPVKPYILFERTDETVHCYMDPRGFSWIEGELRKKLKKEPGYIKRAARKYVEIYSRIQAQWEAEKALSRDPLARFMRIYLQGWAYYEALYFLGNMIPSQSEDFKVVKAALDFTDKAGDQGDNVMRKSLLKLFPELGALSAYLLSEEIFSGKTPSIHELEKRKKKYFYANGALFVDKEAKDMEGLFGIKIENSTSKTENRFRGEIGFKGKVRGKARVILSYSKAAELRQGEVLVTAMTTPGFLPALRKASAFVTDEGGITFHAAIVARELKKPCIIGTKVATRVLQTGDEVEVDANRGMVRVISRAGANEK